MAVPAIVAPPPGHPRFPRLDAQRAIAALAIVLVHCAITTNFFGGAFYRRLVAHLDIGVALFFVLSGFLLYRPLLAARVLGAPRTRLRDYGRRRFLRIAPAYWLALTVLAVLPGLEGVFTGHWWVYYGLLQNWPVADVPPGCAADPFRCGISPTWSLAIEIVFYASLPLWSFGLATLTRRLTGTRWVAAELGSLALLAGVSVLVQGLWIQFSPWLFFSPLGRGWWFAAGMGLAVLSVWAQQRDQPSRSLAWLADRPGRAWGIAAVLYVVPALWLYPRTPQGAFPIGGVGPYVAEYLLFGAIGALLLVPALFETADESRRTPGRVGRTLSWLGLVSYGVFLWHFPVMLGLDDLGVSTWWPAMAYPVTVLAVLLVTVPCAAASYYALERPLMRRKYSRASRRAAWDRNLKKPDPAT